MTKTANPTYAALGDSMSMDIYPAYDVDDRYKGGTSFLGRAVGAASLLHANVDALWPDFRGRDLSSQIEAIELLDLTSDGATTDTVLSYQLPATAARGPGGGTVSGGEAESWTRPRKIHEVTKKRRESMTQDLEIGRLGISPRVRGRHKRDGHRRVHYIDQDDVCRIPEEVVLHRWRKKGKTNRGSTHHGHRLPPRIWAQMGAIVDDLPSDWKSLTCNDVKNLMKRAEQRGVDLPDGERPYSAIADLLRLLPKKKIRKLIDRHPVQNDPLGVPDLVLFWQKADGKLTGPKFVEVKKPEEPVSNRQRTEILFMRDELNLQAGVLRLNERR